MIGRKELGAGSGLDYLQGNIVGLKQDDHGGALRRDLRERLLGLLANSRLPE